MNNKVYQDRAKQFMPFDALKGLQEELREKEDEIEYEKEYENKSYSIDEDQSFFSNFIDKSDKIKYNKFVR